MREGSPNQFAKNSSVSGLETEAKSLFRNILAISPYSSRFCPDQLISTNANSNEMKILGRHSKKNHGGGRQAGTDRGIPDKTDRRIPDTVIDMRRRVEERHALESEQCDGREGTVCL